MTQYHRLAALALLLPILACSTGTNDTLSSGGATVAGLSADDRRAIERVTGEFVNAVNQADWVSAAAAFADDGVMMPPNVPALEGRPAILAWLENYPPLDGFTITIEQVDGREDIAFVHGAYTMTVRVEGMEPFQDTGKFLEVRRKQADGVWRITHDCFNSDLAHRPG